MRTFGGINRISHLPRYREVANILIKHGFGPVFDLVTFKRFWSQKLHKNKEWSSHNLPKRLRLVLEELGPTYIKLGQILSTRPDIMGAEYVRELEKLQNDVPPFPFDVLEKICADEGINISKNFTYFEEEPIAAASMAQVHKAILKTGEEVVVKVQRPNIEKVVETDLEILMELSRILEKRTSWGRLYKITEIVEELGEALRNELDFHKEARNADKFYHNFRKDRNVIIPKVFWEYSSQRVITLEYIEGIKVSDFIGLKQAGYNTEHIAKNLVDALFKQIYDHGFFHADPHPGNIAISSGEKIVFYDFGQVGVIDDVLKEKGMYLVISMMRYDTYGVTRSLLDIGIGSQHVNQEEFRRDVSRLQQKYYGLPLAEIRVAEALGELVDLSVRYQMRLPAELSLVVKMLMTTESLVSQLDPQLSIVDIAEPYGRRLLARRFSPSRVKHNLENVIIDYAGLFKELPRELNNILTSIEEGELKIRMEHANLKRLTDRVDLLSNRLSVAIILASIIVGTSLVVDETGGTIFHGIPLVEIGFVTGIILGLFLVYSILRSGKY